MKSHIGKNTKSGGSDPTFSAFSRPKSLWGRPLPARSSRALFTATKSRAKHSVMQSVLHLATNKEETNVALLKAPFKRPKTATLQVRLEEEVKFNLENYAQFIDATPSYVMSEALKLLFRRDDEFKRWLEQRPNNGSSDHETEGAPLTRTA
jgi:predicted transcriptional regulator